MLVEPRTGVIETGFGFQSLDALGEKTFKRILHRSQIHVELKILTEIIVLALPRMQLLEGFAHAVLIVELELGLNGEKCVDAYALLRAIGLVPVDQLGIAHMPAAGQSMNHHRLADRVVADDRIDSRRKRYIEVLATDRELQRAELRGAGAEERAVADLDSREVGNRHEQTFEGRQAFQDRERNLAAFRPGVDRPIMAIAPDDKRDGVSGVGLDEPLDVELAPLVANLDRVDELGQNHFVGAIGA